MKTALIMSHDCMMLGCQNSLPTAVKCINLEQSLDCQSVQCSVIMMASKEQQPEDCGIIDLRDDSEYTWGSSEEESEEDELKALDVDSSCRIQQTLFDLQYKQQNTSITNIDIEVV